MLRYAAAADTEHLLAALADGPLVGPDTWQPVSAGAASPPTQGEGLLVAPEVQEAVRVEDEVLLLHEGRPVRLSGIGATLWWESRSGATDASLLYAAVQQHGPHPDAQRIVEAAIFELTQRGVVHRLGPQPATTA